MGHGKSKAQKSVLPTIVVDLPEFRSKIRHAWCQETSANPDWSENNSALGQCAVTSLIIQDLFGGELLRTKINEVSHYYNKLPDGKIVDLTREQFGHIKTEEVPETRTREFVLSFPDTNSRYQKLRAIINL